MNILNKTVQDLITEGIITQAQITDLIKKSQRKVQRTAKKARAEVVKTTVSEKLADLLSQPGATVKHRKVWEGVGREEYTRDEVLNSLRSLRDEGVLQNIRTSGNNFQVFWAYVKQPEAEAFGTIDEVDKS
jgi:hypothetical protein